jgi:hypothetical protein
MKLSKTAHALALLLFGLGLATNGYSQSFLTNGLKAYYPFNGNANDASGRGMNGVVNGVTLATDRFWQANSAYRFNGSSWVQLPDAVLPVAASEFTLSAWVLADRGPYNTGLEQIVQLSTRTGEAGLGTGGLGSGSWTVGVKLQNVQGYSSGGPMISNNWAQVVGIYKQGQSLQFWVNGSLIQSNGIPNAALYTDAGWPLNSAIGIYDYDSSPSAGFKGVIDDVRIYNRALPASEVQQLYQYESQPPPCTPHAATATASVVNSFFVGATMTDSGCGYTNTPSVRIIGGGGSGAQAVAVVTNGIVMAVNPTDAGNGYTSTPLVVIEPPFIPRPTMGIATFSLLNFTNVAAGTNYQLQYLSHTTWSNLGSVFTAVSSTFTQFVSGAASPNRYRLASSPVPAQAYATPQVVNGFVVGAAITSGGSGYTSSPTVSIVPNGSGSNATAIAAVSSGMVTNIEITEAGRGYTKMPTIVIAPPPVNALWPTVAPAVRLSLGSLAPYDTYQLEFMPVLGGAWGNLGPPFSSTSTTNTLDLTISGNSGFFRVKYVP